MINGQLPNDFNQVRDLEFRGWQGHVHGVFIDGEDELYIYPHSSSWNSEQKRYTGNAYKVQG